MIYSLHRMPDQQTSLGWFKLMFFSSTVNRHEEKNNSGCIVCYSLSTLFLFFCLTLQPNYVLQTDEHRAGLLARYGPEKLFQAERNFNAAQDLDVSVLEGDLVGVIKQQDPMGSQNRWLIDNGGLYRIICE